MIAASQVRPTESIPDPVLVATVEVTGPLADLDARRDDGATYTSAWILVTRAGRPVGMIETRLAGATLAAGDLERLIAQEVGDAIAAAEPAAAPQVGLPSITVVVPTVASRGEELLACVRRLTSLQYHDFDVVVVDNRRASGLGDDVLEAVAAMPGVQVVREPRPGISAARNTGIAAARGEIVAFTDDDVIVDARWLDVIGRRFADDRRTIGVSGLVLPQELETPAQVWFERSGSGVDRSYSALVFESALRAPRSGPLSFRRFRIVRRDEASGAESIGSIYAMGEFGIGSNMAFRAESLRDLGGFDLALGAGTATCGGEDLLILLRVLLNGGRLVNDPAILVHHLHRRDLPALERQIRGYGTGMTATLVALIAGDPRHLLGLASVVPLWLRSTLRPHTGKRAKQASGYPRHLVGLELRGMLSGPLAYLLSRRRQRRWSP
jgi:GT2 family glycosyltransferase